MENIDCPICASKNTCCYKNFKINKNKCSFNLVRCSCGFIYLNPRPDIYDIKKYYNSNYLPHASKKNLLNFIYSLLQKFTFYWKLNTIKKYVANFNNVLDVGGGKGEFCNYLNKFNIKTTNFEPNLNNFTITLNSYKENGSKFDLIMLWHSLEHIHNMEETLNTCKELLTSDGTLIIAVPNHDAAERKFFKESWIAYDIPRHLYHFNYSTFKLLMNKYNFTIQTYLPMYQDTIFNILVSFKSYNIFKFLYIFFYAFLNITINKNKSSSLLYICKKS